MNKDEKELEMMNTKVDRIDHKLDELLKLVGLNKNDIPEDHNEDHNDPDKYRKVTTWLGTDYYKCKEYSLDDIAKIYGLKGHSSLETYKVSKNVYDFTKSSSRIPERRKKRIKKYKVI